MQVNLYKFTEKSRYKHTFRWTKKHYEFCMDNKIYLSHKGEKIYKEKKFLVTKGTKIEIENNVIAEQYSTMPVRNFSSVGAFSLPTCHFTCNVKIGRFCSIASNVKIMEGSHPLDRFTTHMLTYNGEFDKFAVSEFGRYWVLKPIKTIPEPPIIGNDVWIAEDVVLKGSITIGDGAVIAANSVVTKDVPPYAIVGGVPAKVIRYRFSHEVISELMKIKWWNYNYVDLPDNNKCDDIDNFINQMNIMISNGEIKEYTYKTFNLSEIFLSL